MKYTFLEGNGPILFVLQEKIVTMQILQKLAGKVNRKFDRKLTGN